MNAFTGHSPITIAALGGREAIQKLTLKGRLGRRIRQTAESRKDYLRRKNKEFMRAKRRRLIAAGLRSDGQPRRRPYREGVFVHDVRQAENGEVWLRISAANAPGHAPLRKFQAGTHITVEFAP